MKKKLLFGLSGLVLIGGSIAIAQNFDVGSKGSYVAESKLSSQEEYEGTECDELEDIICSTEDMDKLINYDTAEDKSLGSSIDKMQYAKDSVASDEVDKPVTVKTNDEFDYRPESDKPLEAVNDTTESPNQNFEGIVYPTPDPNKPYDDSPTTEEAVVDTTADETDTATESTTETEEPKKVWVSAVFEDVWVVDKAAWTEEVPVYEDHEAAECVKCHKILYTQAEVEEHGEVPECEPLQYRNYPYSIQIGTRTIIHAEKGHYERKLVSEGHWE